MPPLPSVPDVLRINVDWTLGLDLNAQVRLHASYTGTAPNDAACTTIASDLLTQANTDWLPLQSTAVSLDSFTVTDLSSPTGGTGVFTFSNPGTRSGSQLPADAAVLWNLHIARRYRGGKPRGYFPFGVGGDLTNPQEWSSAAVTAFETGLQNWLTYLSSLTVSGTSITGLVNVSYYHLFTVVTNPTTGRARNVPTLRSSPLVDPVTANGVNAHVASQRRRTLIRS